MKIYSWNVNGIRAAHRKGLLDWFSKTQPDVLCLQETKAQENQLGFELTQIPGYESHFFSAERKGYSGVVTYTKEKPEQVGFGLGDKKFSVEGRTIITKYPNFTLLNIYFPNGKASPKRLKYKMEFYEFLLKKLEELKKTEKNIIICGDVNTAHKEIDLARPKDNQKISGFLPMERAWIDKLLASGFIDSFREINGDKKDAYSWWSMRTRARERNVGWRIDYFFVSDNLKKHLKNAQIHSEVTGSDHCPVSIELEF